MKTLIDHLSQYADYHRDPRNIHTHFVGVPMIMFAVVILLSRPTWMVGAVPVSPALLAALAAGLWWWRVTDCISLLTILAWIGWAVWRKRKKRAVAA